MDVLGIDVILGKKCNYRCKYCYENGNYEHTEFTDENLIKCVRFINKIYNYCKQIDNKTDDELFVHIFFWGGEPFLYMDKILYIIKRLSLSKNKLIVNITTNGSLIQKYLSDILKLNKLCILRINVSYDYCMQNEMRMPGSYQEIRNNIIILSKYNIVTRTITTFSIDKLKYFHEYIKDYYDLITVNPTVTHNFRYNVDNNIICDDSLVLDEESFRQSLEMANEYIKENHFDKSKVMYNSDCKLPTSFSRNLFIKKVAEQNESLKSLYGGIYFAGVLCAINYDGNIYTGMTALFTPITDELKLGTVDDTPEIIVKNRNDLIDKSYNPNILKDCEKCLTCENNCKVIYWRTLKNNDLKTMNGMPNLTYCKIHDLFREYGFSGDRMLD